VFNAYWCGRGPLGPAPKRRPRPEMKFISIIQKRAAAAPGKSLILNPEDYAAAGGELLVIAMVLSWVLTYIYDPDIIKDNQLKRRVGYNNLCVGWDMAPAKYVAAPIFVGIVFFESRFMQLSYQRAAIDPSSNRNEDRIVMIVNFFSTLSWMVCILIFVCDPVENATLHTFSFVQLVVFGYFAYVANFVTTDVKYHPRGSHAFIGIFGLFSLMFGLCAVVQFLMYSEESGPGPIPWWVTAIGDYGWFVCLGVQGYMRPRAPSLRLDFTLTSDDDFQVLGEKKPAAESGRASGSP